MSLIYHHQTSFQEVYREFLFSNILLSFTLFIKKNSINFVKFINKYKLLNLFTLYSFYPSSHYLFKIFKLLSNLFLSFFNICLFLFHPNPFSINLLSLNFLFLQPLTIFLNYLISFLFPRIFLLIFIFFLKVNQTISSKNVII